MENKINSLSLFQLLITLVIFTSPDLKAGNTEQATEDISLIKVGLMNSEVSKSNEIQRLSTQELNQEIRIRIPKDMECLALNIYFEARGESALGRRAVGHVVMNRVNDRRFPNSICDVVHQGGYQILNRCQFSWWCDGRSDQPYNRVQWIKSLKLALEIYVGKSEDPTNGALWYHADYINPYWSRAFQRGPKIGRHIFYREAQSNASL